MQVGGLIRQWRTQRRMSQAVLADCAQVSPRHLSCLETGKSRRCCLSQNSINWFQPSRRWNLSVTASKRLPSLGGGARILIHKRA